MLSHPVFKFFASLKLAVISILSLAGVLAYGTIVESFYGMRGAHHLVYGTWWFYGVLTMLGLNVLCAALSRYPWKRHQTGFVVTHSGILVLLAGSFLTQQYGLDGNLAVTEGSESAEVALNDLRIYVEEDDGVTRDFPVPESAEAREGRLLEIVISQDQRLVFDKFWPRVAQDKKYVPSQSIGIPALSLELSNSRFRVNEWMIGTHPDKPTELNMGPAVLSLEKLWTPADEKRFFSPPKAVEDKPSKIGMLVFARNGKEHTVKVDDHLKRWKPVAGTDLQLIVDKYLPFAVVEGSELVSKSDEAQNPAVQLRVKDHAGTEEKHTIFAFFPEFSTMHGGHQKGDQALGIQFRMIAAAQMTQDMAFVGKGRGKLQFAQSADNKKLYYRSLAANGKLNAQGEVKVGTATPTGWMDLQFNVKEWLPTAVEMETPRSIEFVSGAEAQFPSGLHFFVENGRKPAGAKTESGWLLEGYPQLISVGGKTLTLTVGKARTTLPFAIQLKKFTIGNDPGTTKAASYESDVTVKDPAGGVEITRKISMNEPLDHGGYTFYQASYSLPEGRAPISIFSVNWDPGRWVKYIGSLLICLGASLMFYMNPHYWNILFGGKKGSAK